MMVRTGREANVELVSLFFNRLIIPLCLGRRAQEL